MTAERELFEILQEHRPKDASDELALLLKIYKEGDFWGDYDEDISDCQELEVCGLLKSKRHTSRRMWLGTFFYLTPKGEAIVLKHLDEMKEASASEDEDTKGSSVVHLSVTGR